MSIINLLNDDTINKIAAGEVVERPLSVVKELVENSIDAGATAVTIEIKDGGISYIRITDNGHGILKDDIKTAFLRHATSKIKDAEDLMGVESLGFRGEALASIAAVARCELITKTADSVVGYHYIIEGGIEKEFDEIGAPDGTTVIVRDLFFNTPVRRNFLKSAGAEGSYVVGAIEKIALSHPEISIRLIVSGNTKLMTSGNGKLFDVIYSIFGREFAKDLIEVSSQSEDISVSGYVAKPSLSRGNRNYELFEVNGRTINNQTLTAALEDAYHGFVMQHKYPAAILSITIDPALIDVNVHPSKLEVRFSDDTKIYEFIKSSVLDVLYHKEIIVKDEIIEKEEIHTIKKPAEPFETKRLSYDIDSIQSSFTDLLSDEADYKVDTTENTRILSTESSPDFKYIGSVFDTYLLIEYNENFLLIDQHAAHEKVLYETKMKELENKIHTSQSLNPPIILTLSDREYQVVSDNLDGFTNIGFEFEPFGGKDIAVRAVPDNLYGIAKKELLIEMIDDLALESRGVNKLLDDKIALMSCKAAVKGNMHLSVIEAKELIKQLLSLEKPYTCPHGRPTAILMSKSDIEKKFKRII